MSRHAAQLYNEPTTCSRSASSGCSMVGPDLPNHWEWDAQSRYRNRTLLVLDANEVVAEELFSRRMHRWGPTNRRIGQLRTGSTKTAAVRALLGRLS
jgi:hypothetical protein